MEGSKDCDAWEGKRDVFSDKLYIGGDRMSQFAQDSSGLHLLSWNNY